MNLPPDQALLGRLAVHYKLISPDQLNAAIRHAGRQGPINVADVLPHLGFLPPKQLEWLFSAQQQYLAKQRAAQGSAAIELTPTSALPRPAPTAPEVSPTAVGVSRPAASPTLSTARPAAGTAGALQRILARAVQLKASDVHLHSGSPIQARIHRTLRPLEGSTGAPGTAQILLVGRTPRP